MAKKLEFGYRKIPLDLRVGNVCIETLPDLDKKVRNIEDSGQIYRDWFYAPMQTIAQLGHAERYQAPYPSRIFGLPKTHIIRNDNDLELEYFQFHIWVLSLFTGQRLSATEAGFLDSTPMTLGALTDFVLTGSSLEKAIMLAENYWQANNKNRVQIARFEAAIHALFVAQNPQFLQYEQFIYLYTALDACFAILKDRQNGKIGRINHQERIAWMCSLFKMPVPAWADPTASTGAEVAGLRNPVIHEGLYIGEPMGFAIEGLTGNRNLTVEMEALTCRLLIAIIGGEKSDYIKSEVTSSQRIGLSL